MKTILKLILTFFLINTPLVSSEYSWVQKTMIIDNSEFHSRVKSVVKDTANILSISQNDKSETSINVIINGSENNQLNSKLDTILTDKIDWNSLHLLYNRESDLFYIISNKKIFILNLSNQEINTISFPASFTNLKYYGKENFFVSNSNTIDDKIISDIYKYEIDKNNINQESILSIESDEFRINEFSLSNKNEVLVFSEKRNEAFLIPKVDFYNDDKNVKGGFDFSASYFTDVFNTSSSISSLIAGIHNLDENTWMISFNEEGYYISYDDAETWKFVSNPLHIAGDQEIYNIPGSNKFLLAFGYGKNSFTNIIDDLEDIGTPAKILSSDLAEINFGDGYHKRNISIGTNNEIYTYGQDGWIYKLEMADITSVETNINNSEVFSISPNPVIDYLQIELNSPTTIHSVVIYNLLGNKVLKYNDLKSNTKLDCRSLEKGTYFLVINKEEGYETRKFIKY